MRKGCRQPDGIPGSAERSSGDPFQAAADIDPRIPNSGEGPRQRLDVRIELLCTDPWRKPQQQESGPCGQREDHPPREKTGLTGRTVRSRCPGSCC